MVADIVSVMLGKDCIFSYQSDGHRGFVEADLIGTSALRSLKNISPGFEGIRDAVFAGRVIHAAARPITVLGRIKLVDIDYEPIVTGVSVVGIMARGNEAYSPGRACAGAIRAVLSALEAEIERAPNGRSSARRLPRSYLAEQAAARRSLAESLRRSLSRSH